MKKLIVYIGLVFVVVSCQKVIPLDAETKTSKLVVNALFNENEFWEVNVSRSLSVLDDGDLSNVDNVASALVYDNSTNSLVTSLTYDGENYISLGGVKPVIGKEYRIEVSATNYKSVSSIDYCPSNIPILSFDTSSSVTSFGELRFETSIDFQDPAGSNYYGVKMDIIEYQRIYNSSAGRYDTTEINRKETYLSTSNPVVDNSGPDSYARILTFKDNLFDGQRQTITFNYNYYVSGTPNQFTVRKVSLLSLTESTYKYLKSIETYRNVDGNPFAEPVQVYTNIENGFGIFGGQSSYELKF